MKISLVHAAVVDPAMVPWVPWTPPLWAGPELVQRNTGDGQNRTLLPGKRTKKIVALVHISML